MKTDPESNIVLLMPLLWVNF